MEFSILIGGEAGKGIKWAAKILGEFFTRKDFWTFVYNDYSSVIRGGHNFSIIRVSKEKIYSNHNKIDFLIAFDLNTFKLHSSKLQNNGIIICDLSLEKEIRRMTNKKIVSLPLFECKSPNAAAVAGMILLLKFHIVELEFFRNRISKENIESAKQILKYFKKNHTALELDLKTDKKIKLFVEGSEAIAEGLIAAGLKNYFSYPMTPSTQLLHFLAKNQDSFGLVIQPENEIAVANMALGAIYTGSRTAVGTSGGGFDLMNEAFSLAGMAELPLVVIMAQRPGPSTGVPTHTMQSDLLSSLNAGHGEFPRIVIAPTSAEDAYYWSGRIMELAWQFQVPSILLVDKQITECFQSMELCAMEHKFKKETFFPNGTHRYNITPSGVSDFIVPGFKGTIAKIASYEHNERGISTEDASEVKKMQKKRLVKRESLIKFLHQEKGKRVKFFGELNSKNIVFCWGSTLGAVLEAQKLSRKKFKIIAPIILEPFPKGEIRDAISNAKKIICVENNATGQLASLLKQKLCIECEKILNYNARPFDYFELAARLEEVL